MPYIIKEVSSGFKVCKKDEPSVCFSKKPLSKKTATKQRVAIQISEAKRGAGLFDGDLGGFPNMDDLQSAFTGQPTFIQRVNQQAGQQVRDITSHLGTVANVAGQALGTALQATSRVAPPIRVRDQGQYVTPSGQYHHVYSFGGGYRTDKFTTQLREIGLPPETYLEIARYVAKREGYDPTKLKMALNDDNKLSYSSPEGIKYFGKAGYGDYIIWSYLEMQGVVPEGHAEMKRCVFRKSHSKISDIHNLNKYSPNELAIRILW
jgi:hypothetical protein